MHNLTFKNAQINFNDTQFVQYCTLHSLYRTGTGRPNVTNNTWKKRSENAEDRF